MKKIIAIVLAFLFIFATPTFMNVAYASQESTVDKLIRKTCESLKPYEFTCMTFTRSVMKGGNVVYGYHDIKKICKFGEANLPKSTFNAILKNSGIKSLVNSLKSSAKKNGSASGTSQNIVLNNTTDLKYSINKCNVRIDVKYVPKSKNYEVYITINDVYDFDTFTVIQGCNLLSGNSDLKTCAVSIANDSAAMAQLTNKMSKYKIEIRVDFTTT